MIKLKKIIHGLSFRVFASILTAAFVVYISMATLGPLFVNSLFERYLFSALENISNSQIKVVQEYADNLKDSAKKIAKDGYVRDLAASIEVADNQLKLDTFLLEEIKSISVYISVINIVDVDGNVIASTSEQEKQTMYQSEEYYLNSLLQESGQTFISYVPNTDRFENITESNQFFAVSSPIRSLNSEDIGVLIIYYDLIEFANLIDALNSRPSEGFEQSEYFYVIDSSGNIVHYSENSKAKPIQVENTNVTYPSYNQCEKELSITDEYTNFNDVDVHASFRCITEFEWVGISEIESASVFNPLRNVLTFIFAGLALLFVAGSSIAGGLLWFVLTRRLTRLSKVVNKVSENNLKIDHLDKADDEIGTISSKFAEIVSMLKNSLETSNNKIKDKTKELENTIRKLEINKKELEESRLALFNVMDDIETERNKAEALSEDLKKFELAVENVNTHIIFTDAEGKILYCNKAVENTTGYSKEEVLGNTPALWGNQMSKEYYEDMWNTIKVEKKNFTGEITNKRKNGEEYIAKVLITPIVLDENEDVRFFVGLEEDISKEKQVDQMKTEFVSLASHQLKTPLSAINWYTESLLDDQESLSDEQKEFLQEIYNGSRRMVNLVNALLNVSRIDMGTFSILPEEVDLVEITKSVVEEVQKKFVRKNQTIITNFDQLPKIQLDPNLTRIIVENLVTNAHKYSPDNSEIEISLSKDSNDVILTVRDNGYGIPDNQKDKIFTKLFRADNIREKEADGTGLGLYIVKSIIDNSNGSITFESKENEGTTFTIKFPLDGMQKKEGSRDLT